MALLVLQVFLGPTVHIIPEDLDRICDEFQILQCFSFLLCEFDIEGIRKDFEGYPTCDISIKLYAFVKLG